jgi:serine/threonine-protein kinase
MQTETATWVGQKLASGRFEVTAKLGAGGMGFVYLARDLQEQHDVVIKVPRQQMLTNPEFAGRFTREIRSLIRLVHDHIVKVIDVGEYAGRPFVVLDFLPGGSLRDRFDGTLDGRRGARPRAELKTWLPGIAAALDFCHQHKCIHRDVKPDNILFDAAGRAYLSDFGIAKVLGQPTATQMTVMTAAGMVLGTPQYMAPELILGHGCDGKADQYALAVTVYEALSGKLPVDGPTPAAILVQQATFKPVPLDKLRPTLSKTLAAAVARALAKTPGERFASCAAFAEAVLMALVSADAPPARPQPPKQPEVVNVAPVSDDETLVGAPVKPCPRCKKLLRLTPAQLGKTVRCPRCDTPFKAPARAVPPVQPGHETDAVPQGAIKTPPSSPVGGRRSLAEIPRETRPRSWRRWLVAATLLVGFFLVLIAGGGVAAYLLWPRDDRPDVRSDRLEIQMPEKAEVRPGGEATVTFTVKRVGYRGPVEITAKELPPSLRLEPVTLADSDDSGKFVVTCAGDAAETEVALTVVFKAGAVSVELPLKVIVESPAGELKVLRGHASEVTAVAISGDGSKIVSGGVLGDLRCWKVATGQQLGGVAYMPDPVAGLALSPDGTRALVSYRVGVDNKNLSLRLWPLGDDQPREKVFFVGLHDPILAVGWAAGDEVVAVVLSYRRGQAPYVARWSAATGASLSSAAAEADVAVVAPGSKFALLVSPKGAAMWDLSSLTEQKLKIVLKDEQVLALSAAGDLAVSQASNAILLWATLGNKPKEPGELAEPAKGVASLALSADGKRLLVGGTDGSLRLWDVVGKQRLRSFQGHDGPVKCVAFSADGRLAVSGGADGTVRLWKLPR